MSYFRSLLFFHEIQKFSVQQGSFYHNTREDIDIEGFIGLCFSAKTHSQRSREPHALFREKDKFAGSLHITYMFAYGSWSITEIKCSSLPTIYLCSPGSSREDATFQKTGRCHFILLWGCHTFIYFSHPVNLIRAGTFQVHICDGYIYTVSLWYSSVLMPVSH